MNWQEGDIGLQAASPDLLRDGGKTSGPTSHPGASLHWFPLTAALDPRKEY